MGGEMAYGVNAFDWIWNLDLHPLRKQERHEYAEQVCDAVEALDEPYRTLIELVYWQRATYQEAAEYMGYNSRGNAKHHVLQAERKLRKALRDLDEDSTGS